MSRFLDARWQPLTPYEPGEQPREELVKLNTNESPYPPSPAVQALLSAQAEDLSAQLRLYPDPTAAELRTALHNAYPIRGAFFAGNGSDEVLATIFMAYGINRRVYYPAVSYGFYPVYAQVYGCDAVEVPLDDGQRISADGYQNNDGMILLANPNAPTGLALTRAEIETILRANPDHPVVIDEAYVDFGAQTALPLLADYENLIVVQTFSKSRSLAGLRFGFAAASEAIIADLNRLQFARNPYPIGRLTARIAIESLQDTAYFESCRQRIIRDREYTIGELRARGFLVTESKANFVWASPSDHPAHTYFRALRERKILVRYFASENLKDWLRITIGTKEQMDLLLAAISAIQRSFHDED